jgi:putative nucleotidyltransferase with HDIG domain
VREVNRSSLGATYVAGVQVVGSLILLGAVADVATRPPGWFWLFLTAVTALTGTYAVKIPGVVVRLSISEPIVFVSTLLFGPAAGTVTAAVEALVMSLRLPQRLRTPHRILFNVGALAVSVLPSGLLYFRLIGGDPRNPVYGQLGDFVGPAYIFASSVFLLNSLLVALAVSIERNESAFRVWRHQFSWLSASYLASAAIAAIVIVLMKSVDVALAVVLLPLAIVSFLAIKTTLGRLDDTNKHLIEVNALHLSTIETLAMAIDAKDQVTHGHIRRVQRFAVGLAEALGVVDHRQLRAIEAAALLHDMGKLAIPEFILNKPGRLTAREFSVMQTHAAVGADLLSSIDFPYPVVPIVRHHHENWNGSGYPHGLRGAEIPIGARILAVVDCYDALTSHRPYRPAMAPEIALEILMQRRGTMYDPLVVDAFVGVHGRLNAATDRHPLPAALLASQPESVEVTADSQLPTNDALIASLAALAHLSPFPSGPSLQIVCRQLVDSLRSVASFDTVALFVLDDVSNAMVPIYRDGPGSQALERLRIPVSERLSGWVAAHKTAVWNSDAALDLALSGIRTGLSTASSFPLTVGESVIAVLTLYGLPHQEISLEQRRTLELLLPTLAHTIEDAIHLPAVSIDCRFEWVRESALQALDSLLSHRRRAEREGPGAVMAVSVSPLLGDDDQIHPNAGVLGICQGFSTNSRSQRCVLVLSITQLLICALDHATCEDIAEELQSTSSSELLHAFHLSWYPIRSSFDLHDRVRRLSDASAAAQSSLRLAPGRVH